MAFIVRKNSMVLTLALPQTVSFCRAPCRHGGRAAFEALEPPSFRVVGRGPWRRDLARPRRRAAGFQPVCQVNGQLRCSVKPLRGRCSSEEPGSRESVALARYTQARLLTGMLMLKQG